ncbi:MAG: hypothetical protein KAG92_01835, partial [Deltaproteobacteria bacterium]|nr:hypothetical protein [Deltaproteobacteria bacterium]
EDGIQLKQGACYISSYQEGVLLQSGPDGTICLTKGEDENEPLNQLFVSAANLFQENTIGVLLTGIGTDGSDGFAHIQKLSGTTIAQNTQTCVYPNLTDHAIRQGTVNTVLDESDLAQAIISIMTE